MSKRFPWFYDDGRYLAGIRETTERRMACGNKARSSSLTCWIAAAVFTVMSVTHIIAQELPVEGNPDSPVRVIEYEDLQCGDCANYRTMLDEHLLPKFGDRVAFVHKDFPLPKHQWAARAAVAGRFFASKGSEAALAFRRYCLFERYEITTENFNEKLGAFAEQHGLDAQQAIASLADTGLQQLVNRDFQEGVARGVSKTPTVYVGGTPFIETFTAEEISAAIEKTLTAAQQTNE
jgi:protein-disulfide isomerase